jgi:hypothetical protein
MNCECGCERPARRRFIHGHNRRRRGVTQEYIEDSNGCWLWQLACDDDGYGVKNARRAHVVYYERVIGLVPEGLELDHRCRVVSCVNPAHLEAVTPTENKRRSRTTKLTVEVVREIRASPESPLVLAERFGVDRSNISHIRRGKSWGGI